MQTLIDYFGINNYLPHGYCLTWNPALLWTTVLSDSTMALAYGSYPLAVTYFVWKRQDLEYRWLYLAFFNGFILTCASTHLMSAVTVWLPLYWVAAYVKAISAAVAVATVFAVWWVIPRALNLPSPADLRVQRNAAQYARSLLEASLDPLVTISAEGKITDVNEATERATGRGRRELIGTDFSDYFTEPDKAREGYQQVLRQGSVTDYPLALRHVSGTVMEVVYNASVYRNERGEVAGVFAAARDITERKRAEEELRGSEERFRALADATSEGMLIHEKGRIVEVNRHMEDILGRPRAQIVGATVLDFVVPAWRDMVSGRVTKPEDARTEFAFLRPDGSEVVVSGLAHPCMYQGRPMRVAAYRDITLEKQAEETLKTAGAYNRSLIEASLDPLVTISPGGKITDVNEATVKATGLAREDLIGSDFSDYFTEPDKARAGYQEVFTKGFVKDYPLALRHASGEVMEVLYNASVYRNDKGEVAGVFAAARDITERKRAEEELRKYHEHLEELVRERTSSLEAANKELEGFAYSVSHDLRVPLRAIDGFSQQVLKHYADKLDDEGQRYLNVVRDNTKKMSQLIDDILAFSRMGRLGMSMTEINMEELAHGVFEDLRPALAGRELSFKIGSLPHCHGDLSMLRQVLTNLVGNAIKFTRHKEAALVEVGGRTEGSENIYYVKDNGAGFDMQYADKLFGVFQRLHGVTEFEGTGIGLAIVKRIVTRHGGRVWAEGKVDEGATLYFALPIKENS